MNDLIKKSHWSEKKRFGVCNRKINISIINLCLMKRSVLIHAGLVLWTFEMLCKHRNSHLDFVFTFLM